MYFSTFTEFFKKGVSKLKLNEFFKKWYKAYRPALTPIILDAIVE